MYEETGCKIKNIQYFNTYIDRYGVDGDYVMSIAYLAQIIDKNKLSAHDDISSVEWINLKTGKINSRFESVNKTFSDLEQYFDKQK